MLDRFEQQQLEDLYSSSDISDLYKFMMKVDSVEKLVNFSKNRQDPKINLIKENFDKDTSIIFVIPTKDSNGSLAKSNKIALENYPIIFVESWGQFFNFSKSMNSGIREALKYDPEWIILSNDDLTFLSDPRMIRSELISKEDFDFIIPEIRGNNAQYGEIHVMRQSQIIGLIYKALSKLSFANLSTNYSAKFHFCKSRISLDPTVLSYINVDNNSFTGKSRVINSIANRFILSTQTELLQFRNIQPFSAIKPEVLIKEHFDEIYLNGGEDSDLSIRLSLGGYSSSQINVVIGSRPGTTLGDGLMRVYRNTIPERAFLGHKLYLFDQNDVFLRSLVN